MIKSRSLRWAGNSAKMEEGRSAGKRYLGRSTRGWKKNISMDLKKIRGIGLIRLMIEIIGDPL